jgi:hypothetical protein
MLRVFTDKATEITLNRLIDALGLPIGLGMVTRAHLELGASCTKHRLPKLTGKDWVSIRNQGERQTMQTKDVVNKNFGNFVGSKGVADGQEMCIFGQLIHNHKNAIELPGGG